MSMLSMLMLPLVANAACGEQAQECTLIPGGCDLDRDAFIDSNGDLGLRPDRPGGMQGCLVGQKATWIHVQDTPERIGKLGCVPDGVVGAGAACVFGTTGESTGFDDCAAGLVCSEGVCADICSFDAPAGTLGACATGTCTVDPLLFANGSDDPVAGVCR